MNVCPELGIDGGALPRVGPYISLLTALIDAKNTFHWLIAERTAVGVKMLGIYTNWTSGTNECIS